MRRRFSMALCALALTGGTAMVGADQADAHISSRHGPFSSKVECNLNLIAHRNAGQAKPGAACYANPFNFQWYW